MSTANLFRPINIDNTADSKTEANYIVEKLAKPETTVTKTHVRFALSDTTISAAGHFTVNHQQPKTNNDSIQPLNFVSTQKNFQTNSLRKTLKIVFSQNTYFLNFLEISPRTVSDANVSINGHGLFQVPRNTKSALDESQLYQILQPTKPAEPRF